MMDADSGQQRRARLPENVRGSLSPWGEVRVIELNLNGAMIEHTQSIPPGQTGVLGLRLAEVEVRLQAQVLWSQPYSFGKDLFGETEVRYRSGLHFPALSEAAESHLRNYLATLSGPPSDVTYGQG
jgi:hypothetical protein